MHGGLTDEEFWDDYWRSLELPLEVTKQASLLVGEITDVFDRFFGRDEVSTVAEIGGAPGQYAAYVRRNLGRAVTVLDNSPVGIEKTRENFRLLGLTGNVVAADLFAPPPELGKFDAVFSLGLIEHFADLTEVVRAHAMLVKSGGLLLLGVPNLRGINAAILRRLSPSLLALHEPAAMDASSWDSFERELGLRRLYRSYLGGFEASTFWRCDSRRLADRAAHQLLWHLGKGLDRSSMRFLRRVNNRAWSAYLIGVYRVGSAPGSTARDGDEVAPERRERRQRGRDRRNSPG